MTLSVDRKNRPDLSTGKDLVIFGKCHFLLNSLSFFMKCYSAGQKFRTFYVMTFL